MPSAVALAALFVFASACDGCSDDDTSTACDKLGNECGKTCTNDGDCKAGLYCGASDTCTADCTPSGGECGPGKSCDLRGHCIDEAGGTGQGGSQGSFMGDGGSVGQGGDCGQVNVDFAPQIPTVVLLVDQSGSMTDAFGGGTRWDVLHDVLMNPTTGVVSQLESQVRFGLALYTGTDQDCPAISQVNIAIGNRDEIEAVYGAAAPIQETPTGDSINEILPGIVGFNEPGQKIIVLATDGEPDTCAVPNPQNGQPEAIAAAQAAFQAGVNTYIIAVGSDVSLQHQQDMANAGVGKPLDGSQGNAPYYPAGDQAALVAAFNEIINGVRSCVLNISKAIDPAKAGEGHVYVDGVEIGYQDPNGWQLDSPTQIELLGTSCEAIQNGNHTVTGVFDCNAIIPQ